MKRILLLLTAITLFGVNQLSAQCTTANINWDNLDYLVSTGNYAGFVTDARTRDQRFAFGPGSMRMQVTTNITISGENASHTGSTNTYGSGEDVAFTTTTIVGLSTITLTFPSAVSNLRFSIYDLDNGQRMSVTALNVAAPVSTTLSIAPASSSAITFTANPGFVPTANGIAGGYASTDNRGAVNIDITNPVTSIVLSFTSAVGDFWLSDFQGCVPGTFPTAFHAVSQPWPLQPSYMTVTPDTNLVQSVNPANGQVKTLFAEPGSQYVNSLGYDPHNKVMYYVMDDVNAVVVQKGLKKYNFDTETMSTVVADVATLGIPYFEIGVESGGGSYYDSCFYLGIEGGNSSNNSGRECIIWRIEFDASQNPVSVVQTVAFPADNGSGSRRHDWGDFVITNGILYDYNSGVSSPNVINQYNLQTGALTVYNPTFAPKQVASTWDDNVYHLSTIVRRYNGTTGYAALGFTMAGPGWIGGSGDGGEAFKPKADYGDAPSTYDPAASPAVHERDTLLRLGSTFDWEWLKEGSTPTADADGADEDGLSTVPLLCPCSGNFFIPVRVFNNTGATATLIAWLDYDGDGIFESGETQSATVNSSASLQIINLNWTNAWTTLPDNAITYLRIRLTSTSNGMTTSNPSGYFDDGEVEDYRVVIDGFPLAVNIISFTASKDAYNNVQLNWKSIEDASLSHYYVQKSRNGKDWANIGTQQASGQNSNVSYNLEDASLLVGTTYYRLQLMYNNGNSLLSDVRQISHGIKGSFILAPNPASKQTVLTFIAGEEEITTLALRNSAGGTVQSQKVKLSKGSNAVSIDVSSLPAGLYTIQMKTAKGIITDTLIKN